MVGPYMLDTVLDRIKEIIGIEEFDHTKILVDADDKLPENNTSKNIMILTTCIKKDDGKFYSQLFLEEALLLM